MKRCATAVLAGLLVGLAGQGQAFKRTEVGQPLKEFTLKSAADGGALVLGESLGGKATLVVFWAAWSPRSAEALRDYQELYAAHGPAALQVVAVNVEHQTRAAGASQEIARYAQEHGLQFPVVVDEGLAVFDAYGVIAVPSTLLLDAGGTVVALLEGYSNMTRHDFRERVLKELGVLQEAPPPETAEMAYRPKGKAARYYRMGERFFAKKQSRRAIASLERAVEEDPDYADADEKSAEIYAAEGFAEEAGQARERAADLRAAQGAEGRPAAAGGAPAPASLPQPARRP